MPELPEVESLRDFLTDKVVGHRIELVELAAFSALKTFDPPLAGITGLQVSSVQRHGKFLDIDLGSLHLVFHLARAGWLRWSDDLPRTPLKPGKGPTAARVRLDDGSGFTLTEAGTQRKLAIYVVTDVSQVPGIVSLGPDPLAADFTEDRFRQILHDAGRAQLKGVLRDQRQLAGVGNAYSDEILHAARLSPFKPASALTEPEFDRLYQALRTELRNAVERSAGVAAKNLKAEKRSGLRVHGRTGDSCDVCGATIAEVSFADRSLQYCPTCQTGGKPLADRRLSKLLK